MDKLKIFAFVLVAFVGLSRAANANAAILAPDDFVGITFWVISMGMLAATAFFFFERSSVAAAWRTPVTVAGLITGIAFINYMFMRGAWVQTADSPTVYRYIDWFITMPLQMVEFYLILAVVRKISNRIFWRLLIGSLVMVGGAYAGETGHIKPILGLVISIGGWVFVLYEIFSGEAGKAAAKSGNKIFVTAFGILRMIVTVGWCIYPLGYVFGYLTGSVDGNSLNIIYNLADFVNKIAFGLVIWIAATQSTNTRAK
jgi:bacteriorhodopsin